MVSQRREPDLGRRTWGRAACSRCAFTLIELLVVVAIIALLVAILLPSLAVARDQANAAVCAGRMKECTRATIVGMLERQQERASSNFGWGTPALGQLSGVTGVFRCPSDENPDPVPAFLDWQYRDGQLMAIASPDSPFSTFQQLTGDRWRFNIQDQITGSSLGADLDTDLVFEYDAPKGATVTKVKLVDASVAWGHTITDYRSHTLADKTPGREFTVPLMWGSYAMNASAGLRNQKSNNLILLIEYRNPTRKWAAVPENLGGWPRDANLGNLVQYRHGGKKRVNIGFIDGHVERSGDKKKLSLRDSSWWHPPRPKGWVAEF